MNALSYWGITAFVCILFAGLIGRSVTYLSQNGEKKGSWLGILIDERQRFSLTHFQTVLWTLVFLSLLIAIILARYVDVDTRNNALNIEIPPEVLTLAGITGGSAVLTTAVKSPRTEKIRKLMQEDESIHYSHFSQIFMVEEGKLTDKVVDITKFQNFFLTLIAVIGYIVLAASVLGSSTGAPTGFPSFSQDLLWFIGISHTAYVGGKIPDKTDQDNKAK